MTTMRLHTVKMDCHCGNELEVIVRVMGKASRWQYADSRECEIVSILCENGCDFSPQEVQEISEEAEAIACDEAL